MAHTDTSCVKCVVVASEQEFDDARSLFRAYKASFINFDAGFPNFEAELSSLPVTYSDGGAIIVAYHGQDAVGCIAIKKYNDSLAELKRFYVLPTHLGMQIGAKLLNQAIEQAKILKFDSLRLEVIPTLQKAKQLYVSFGFELIEPYCKVEIEGTAHFQKLL